MTFLLTTKQVAWYLGLGREEKPDQAEVLLFWYLQWDPSRFRPR